MWSRFAPPSGMNRRHFMSHMAGAGALLGSSMSLGHSLRVHADTLKKNHKSCVMLWMGGGPSSMDIWDLKPGTDNGGPFKAISTSGDMQICEHMPLMAKQMHHMSIVRSMSTREADHNRGRYYMHTGYVPDANVDYPSYGSVVSHELMAQRSGLEIPPFVSVGGASEGPGFLGMAWAPFNVSSTGRIRNMEAKLEGERLAQRRYALETIENSFIAQKRGTVLEDHRKVLGKTFDLLTSAQMEAFNVEKEPDAEKEKYGKNGFGQGCLLARRLVEAGVPFVEVDLGGWDNHQRIFQTLENDRLPTLDKAMSALVGDLSQRGLLEDTAIVWMGEFARTPRINAEGGRDHWARAWSVVVGGAGIKGGKAVGATNEDGTQVDTEPYSSEDLMASVCHGLGISLETTFTSRNGRPMKIANSGKIIKDLFG
ncbi:MAG: DUF1501 domain-containing protein [Planctomycetota bacterium]|nr:DUF1501 domain-containing protein [Planctomycetota bacterium]